MKKLGKYELIRELGRGAFGIVYQAMDPVIGRMVALKTITSAVADDPNLLARFYREARSAGFLQHPNIVTIYDMGDEQGTPFISMELVDGQNLDHLIGQRDVVPLSLKLLYAVQACRAFEYAHKRGIIHRDIKPGNVMVSKDGVVKVVDFGIARILESSKTQTGALIGTISYMAPEAFHGEHGTERSDIWSFGVLLYELLSHKPPFSGQNPAALMQSICMQEPAPLRKLAPECPEDIESLVHRMLRKPEGERIQSMEEVLLDLEPICRRLQGETIPELLADADRLIEHGEFASARELLRQVFQADPASSRARVLSDKAAAGLKSLSVRKKVQQHLDKAHASMQVGESQEAAREVENALQLDSQHEPARQLQQAVHREIQRVRLANDYIQSAKQQLVEGTPEGAESLLLKAQELDPSNAQLPMLERQVREETDRRQRRARRVEGLQQARAFWSQRKYQECLDLLTKLEQEFPGEEEVLRLLETVQEEQAEQEKRQKVAQARALLVASRYDECIEMLSRLRDDLPDDAEISRLLQTARQDQAECERQQRLEEARGLLAEQRFVDALVLIDRLLARSPGDSAVVKLRKLAEREQEIQARSETFQREWESLKKLAGRNEYSLVITRAEDLLHQFPAEPDLLRLVEFTRNQQAQIEKERHLRSFRTEVKDLLEAGGFAEAASAAQVALAAFPGDAEMTALLERAQARIKKDMVHQVIEQRIREIKLKINRGELSEARELARETLTTLGPDTDVQQLLSSAEVEYEAREKKNRQDQKLDRVKILVGSGKLEEAAAELDALTKSGDFDRLDPRLYQIAENITAARGDASSTRPASGPQAENARQYAILDGSDSIAGDVATSNRGRMVPLPQRSSLPGSEIQPPARESTNSSGPKLSQATVTQAARVLARYVGPISGVLAKRAAQTSETSRAFYLRLAEHLETETERAEFLRDSGLAE